MFKANRFLLVAFLAILLSGVLVGCQGETITKIYGHLLRDGKNQVGFTVVLTGTDGKVYKSEPVGENGIYDIRNIPTGDYVVTVLDVNGNTVPGYEDTIFLKAGEPRKMKIEL